MFIKALHWSLVNKLPRLSVSLLHRARITTDLTFETPALTRKQGFWKGPPLSYLNLCLYSQFSHLTFLFRPHVWMTDLVFRGWRQVTLLWQIKNLQIINDSEWFWSERLRWRFAQMTEKAQSRHLSKENVILIHMHVSFLILCYII